MPLDLAIRRLLRSWGPALALAAILLASKALVLVLLVPRLSMAPDMAEAWRDPGLPSDLPVGVSEPVALVARYRLAATPALAARLDALARQLGHPEGAPGAPLEMLRLLAEDDRLIPPGLLLPDPPREARVVCDEPGDGYLCLMLVMHLQEQARQEGWGKEP